MKCTNENFRNVVFFNDTGHSAWSAAEWPCGAFRGMVAWTNTRKRICVDEESEENRSGRKVVWENFDGNGL